MTKTFESDAARQSSWPANGGEMGELIRATDWSRTPLGPVSSWSPSLRMMVRFLLANRFPLLLWWGPEFIQIYNDAYRPVLGAKHPDPGLGRPVSECWAEIWHILRPLIETPFNGGPSTWMEDIFLEVNRYGFVEETHFTIAYSPVPDDTVPSGIGGVLATVHEISEKVVGERRITALRDLGARAVEAKTAEEACAAVAETLARHARDVPFALLYLVDPDGRCARLAGASGVDPGGPAGPAVVDLDADVGGAVWPLAEVVRSAAALTVDDLAGRLEGAVPAGPWSDPPRQAVVVPIRSNVARRLAGLLVAGVSPRLRLDDSYRSFLELAAGQVATAIANARAYDEERRRAEALAELDRAKTAFFSNVSHEFRTPLTLMLGPIEDALAEGDLPGRTRERLDVAHRNSRRLLKLVNALLDFSRIEAGRVEAAYEPVDLAAFTADLAGVFRSAVERAGLEFVVDCQPAGEPVYVDREMWEKIVFNLLSNALKFTFDGRIEVSLRRLDGDAPGGSVELTVSDTGTGIPEDELPRLFERFYRVKGASGRTYEGSGIGLALVRELVKLHGGHVRVRSRVGSGSAFAVAVPLGAAHLPAARVGAARSLASTAVRGEAYLEEALGWVAGAPEPPRPRREAPAAGSAAATGPYLLVADDNADMREYLRRLLGEGYAVSVVADGEAALEAARTRPPDLVLADVMMPKLDGFGLLAALRADERTATVPVILLSARAGEESRVEGLEAGADDYLVKPFSARELLARVESNLKLERLRRESRERLLALEVRARAEAETSNRLKDEFLATVSHELRTPLNAVMGWAKLLEVGSLDAATSRRAAEAISRNAAVQAKLIEDILDVSRIVTGKVRLDVRRVDLAQAVLTAVESARPAADAKRVRLEADVVANGDAVPADADRLQQILANLLSNSVKFTPAGGVVRVCARAEGGEAEIVVADSGEGIDPDFLPHVFERFRQADGSTARRHGGLGLGLAIVRHLVELHGGSVRVESPGVGLGTTFVVRLPLGAAASVASGDRAPDDLTPRGADLGGTRVLVVDDEPDAREVTSCVLAAAGAEVRTASSAAEAILMLSAWLPDVLVADIGMPTEDGYALMRRVRELPAEKGGAVPALAVTAYARTQDCELAFEVGFQDHVAKPVPPRALVSAVARLRAAARRDA